jgi:thiamine transport system substrate-binding protein
MARRGAFWLGALFLLGAAACGGGSDDKPVTLVLLAYDSFTPSADVFDEFTAQTGIRVELARSGDAGELVAKAVLTAGNPEGDVLWGVDNTLLSRALDADLFEPHLAKGLEHVPARLRDLVPGHEVTPVDEGDVCVNVDLAALDERGLPVPETFDDLADPSYRGLLVVPSAATSSPGLAFLLATIDEYGEDGWEDYWRRLRANDVLVVDGWSEAYYGEFTRAGGDRPLVVSYGTSPPAEVIFAEPPLPADSPAPTAVVQDTCFRQVEFAGILRGSRHVDEARLLVDYLLGTRFQEDLPLTLFVYPANERAALPDVFVKHAVRPVEARSLDPDLIASRRAAWVDRWTAVVLR